VYAVLTQVFHRKVFQKMIMMSLLNKKIEGEQIREKFFAKAVLNWSRPGQKMSSLEEADAIFYLDNFGSCSPKNIQGQRSVTAVAGFVFIQIKPLIKIPAVNIEPFRGIGYIFREA
jgi:hypothetical protein